MGFNSNNLTNEDIRSLCENNTCWFCPYYSYNNSISSLEINKPIQIYPILSSKKEVENV